MSRSKEPKEPKEPFVSKEDRPDVKLPDPDQPLSELRVRDLQAIIAQPPIKKIEVKEQIKIEKVEKPELKDLQKEIYKELKHEKIEIKEFKEYKPEKHEKHEKIEIDPLKRPEVFEIPNQAIGPDPLQTMIDTIAGLTKKVDELSNQVAELQRKGGK